MHRSINILVIFLAAYGLLDATTYYVSNTGSNSNTGLSPAQAFQTLQYAADQVSAGDTVFVANGTYAGFDLRDVNGTASDPIVFIANGNNVLINSSGPIRSDGINIENADYVVIDGFIVNNMTGNGNGIRVVLSDFCVVRNCSCDNNAERGIFTGFTDDILIEYNVCTNSVDEHGIYVSNSSDRPIVRYNECYGNNNIGIHMNGDLSAGEDGIIHDAQVYGNILHDNNLAAGINMDGVLNPVIYNNLIFNNHFAQGIALFQQDGAIPTSGAKVYNNTIIVPSDGRWGILVTEDCNINTEIYNNIIINLHAWRGSITVEDITDFTSDYNILINSMSATGDGSSIPLSDWQDLGLDLNSQLADPLGEIFTNPAGGNYHLLNNSQAVNAGTNIVSGIVQDDLDGNPRPIGSFYDIGAYEHDSPLAVHIIEPVRAWVHDNEVHISWTVLQDHGTAGFVVERSVDAKSWNEISAIKATAPHNGIARYEDIDHLPAPGRSYYRVAELTTDGQQNDLGAATIFNGEGSDLQLFPNPASDRITVISDQNNGLIQTVEMVDSKGSLVQVVECQSVNVVDVDVSSFPPGKYYVIIRMDNGRVVTRQVALAR